MTTQQPLRLWPLGVIAAIYAAIVLLVPLLPLEEGIGLSLRVTGGAVLSALLIVLWWLLASRARWFERIGVAALLPAAILGAHAFVDPSIAGGAQGYMAYILGFASFGVALACWAVIANRVGGSARYVALIASLLVIGAAPLVAIRTAGVKGGGFDLHWRWTPTPEEILLAKGDEEPKPLPAAAVVAEPIEAAPAKPEPKAEPTPQPPSAPQPPSTPQAPSAPQAPIVPAEWPGFRGPNRDGVVHTAAIKTDWNQTPPVQMWHRAVGPGWSSFSVRGDLLYTQEQRGDDEIVACYRVSTGEPVWRHKDPIRFYESNGGAGPRGTPTIYGNRIYSMGATAMLNALDAHTGRVIWAKKAAVDTKRQIPMWGISSSPLVVNDLVVVAVNGTLAAYDIATGAVRWLGPKNSGSYSSPQLVTFDGVQQIVILTNPGAVSVNPADGKLLWEHIWEGGAIVQPAVTEDGDILINAMAATGGIGTRRLSVKKSDNGWTVEEKWTTNGLKPYFNDLVIHKGYAYGFDGAILSAIDLTDGKRKWKGGRYGNGQLVLLADQDVLLVISEDGELALVSATPDQYKEIARIPALNAKTWNHPVIVRDVLLIRNGEEMAAYKLPLAEPSATVH